MQLKWKSKPAVIPRDRAYLVTFLVYCIGVIVGYIIGRY